MSEVTPLPTLTTSVERNYPTVKPETLLERGEFLSAILGSAWESWDWWKAVDYTAPFDWDNHPKTNDRPFLTILADDPDGDEGETVKVSLTVADLYEAYISVCSANSEDLGYYENYGIHDLDLDAIEGDHIIQFAVFGTLIYG